MSQKKNIDIKFGPAIFIVAGAFLSGCTAAMNPPTLPAIEVAPDVKLLWPQESNDTSTAAIELLPSKTDSRQKTTLGIDNGIIAVVNQKAITLKEFDQAFFRALQNPNWRSNEKELYRLILNDLIERQLLLLHAKELPEEQAIVISDRQVEQELERVVANIDGGWSAYQKILEQEKMSIEDISEQIKDNLIISRVQAEMFRGLGMPSPREIQKEYANNINSFKSPESRDIGLITVYLGDYKNNPEKGKKIIKNIEDGLFSGQDFSQLAVRYSDGAKAQEGGRQGWIQKKDLAEDIAKVAFSLEHSRHSGPHQMGDLVFFTKCFDVQPASTQPLSDVRNQIHQKLYQRKRDQVKNKKINALKRKCHIERLPPEAYIAYRRSLSKPQPRQP